MTRVTNLCKDHLVSLLSMMALITATGTFAQTPQYSFIGPSPIANTIPFASATNQREWIYYPSDFPTAPSGYIDKIYVRASAVVSPNLTNLLIMMGPTTLSTFVAGSWVTANLVTVASYPTFSTSSIINNWIPIPLQTPFYYNNTSNFIVLCTQGGYSPGFSINQTTLTARSLIGASTASPTVQDRLGDFGFDLMPLSSPNDAGISAITSPVNPSGPGLQNVKVTLKNYGTDTLSSAMIGWSVNGTVQTPYTWTGSLPNLSTDTGIIIGSYNFPLGTHTIKAWSYLPNSVADTINNNDTATITLQVCNVISGTYTIGATGADYPTFNAALSAVQACGINGPVTFNVLPGTYTEQLSLTQVPGASLVNRITFQSSTGNPVDVTLKNNAATGGNFTLKFNGGDYYTVQNITIKAEHATNAIVVDYTGNANFNILNGNIIMSQPATTSTAAGIFSNNMLDNYNVISNNKIYGGYYGIYMSGVSSSSAELGLVIENNLIEGWYYYGLNLTYIDGLKVRGNTIRAAAGSGINYGGRIYYCDQDLEITKNRIECKGTSTMYGFYIYYCDGNTSALVANNFIAQTNNNNTTTYGIYAYYSTNLRYYHNTIRTISTYATAYTMYVANAAAVANNQFINNILVNESAGYAFYATGSGATGITVMDYNDIYSPTGSYAYWNTAACADLAALKTNSGMNTNSVSINPLFISATQLYPSASQLDNKGTPLMAVPDDIDGKIRNLITPDIGAAEFTVPANDAGISAILSPISPIQPGSFAVTGRLKNFGLVNLATATLSFSVNGSSPVNYIWAGNLAPDSTEGPITIGNYNFPLGTHTLKVWTSLPNGIADSNNINDTMTMSITVCQLMSGTYTIGDSTANYQSFGAAIAAMTSCGINGNVTFNVMPGTYTEQLTVPEIPGTSLANRVTFQSLTGNQADVILTWSPTVSTNNWVVKLSGADYISFMNMTIKVGSTATYGYPVYLESGANYNLFQGNKLETQVTTSSSFGGIYNSSAALDQYNFFLGNTIKGGYYGAYWYGVGTTSLEAGNTFENNIFQDFYVYGMYGYYQDGIVLTKNRFTNASNSATAYGLYLVYLDNGIRITKNRINLTGSGTNYGIYMSSSDGTSAARGLIANNFISYSGASTTTVYNLYTATVTNQDIYHNSISITSGPAASRCFYPTSTSLTNIKNNIFSNTAGGYSVYWGTTNSSITMDYNNLYSTGTNLAWWTSNQTNLSGWQTASMLDSNSVSLNPFFYTPSLLYPGSFAMDNEGVFVTEVPDDIDDKVRSLTTPDIGAAEYSPPQDDAGITAIHSPVTPTGPGTYPVSVNFKNFGISNLTSVKLNWKLDTFPVQTQLWVGFLAPDSTYGPQSLGNVSLGYGTYTFKAWTSEPNNALDGSIYNDTMTRVITVCDIMDSIYTIGDTLSDYPSFTAAINAMLNCGISDTVIFNVKPGTYAEKLDITPIPGASASARVIFQSATGNPNDVILTYAPTGTADNFTLRFNGADYVSFRAMKIRSTGASYGRVVEFINGANFNVLDSNIIETTVGTSSNFSPLYSTTTKDEYNIISNNTLTGGYYGAYWYGPSTSDFEYGNQFINNKFLNYYYYGLMPTYQSNVVVRGNLIQNSTATGVNYPLRVYYCGGTVEVSGNELRSSGTSTSYGLYIYYTNGSASTNAMVYNNLVTYQGTSTGTIYGIYMTGSNYVNVYNNTVNILNGSATATYCIYYTGTNTNIRIVNNIMVNRAGGYGPYVATAGGIISMNYNDYYVTGANFGFWASAQASFALWQTASLMDSNSVNIDPVFYTPSLLIPSASALDDKGTPVAGVTRDFYGTTRDLLTPDIGAVEWDPLTTDLGMLSWDYPSQYACGLSTAEPVKVTYYNNSISAQSGYILKYSINGGTTWVSDTVTAPLAIGDTVQHTFTQGADFSAIGPYNCKTAVVQLGDQFHMNDTVSRSFTTQASVSAFPMLENLESFTVGAPGTFANGWTIEPATGFRWQVNSGLTASASTGPDIDHTLGTAAGKYAYTEADGGATGDQASLISPCLDLGSLTAPQVRFWYHMYGANIDKLSLDVAQNGVWHNNILVITGQHQTSATAPWQMAVASLAAFPDAEKIRFRVTKGAGALGDVAVDDINIEQAPAYEAALLNIEEPAGGCGMGLETVKIKIQNKGASTVNGNLMAYYQLGTSASVSQAVTDSIPSGDTLIFTFATPVNLATTKDTNYAFMSYIALTGDPFAFNDTAKMQVSSLVTPPNPQVTNATIYPGDSATLKVNNADSMTYYYWYDVPVGGTELAINDTFVTPPLFSTTQYFVEGTGGGGAGNLQTIMTSNNALDGAMFDVTAFKNVRIDSFYTNLTSGTTIEVYYKLGTYVGYETNAAAWTLLGMTNVVAAGTDLFTRVPIGGLTIAPGQTYGIYMTTEAAGSMRYTNGTGTNQYFSDGNMEVELGAGLSYKFTGLITAARVWNGKIFYSSGNGCITPRIPDTVFVVAPVVVANAGPDLTICAGDTAQLNVTATGGVPPYSYAWSPATSLTNATISNPKAFPATNTTYSVTVTDQNNDHGTDGVIVTVTPAPFVSMPPLANVCDYWPAFALAGGSPAGGTYSGTGVSSGMFNPATAGVGTHPITYSFTNPTTGCTGHATQNIYVDACIGISEPSGLRLELFPNPATDVVNIDIAGITEPLQMKLMNVEGQAVYTERLSKGNATINRTIDVSKLPAGVYYIRLEGESTNKVEKVVIE